MVTNKFITNKVVTFSFDSVYMACLFPIFSWCQASLALEEVVESGRVGKVQPLGYLVGQQAAGAQQHLGTQHDGTVDPVHDAVAAGLADDR